MIHTLIYQTTQRHIFLSMFVIYLQCITVLASCFAHKFACIKKVKTKVCKHTHTTTFSKSSIKLVNSIYVHQAEDIVSILEE
jgi:hypothetical protein